MDERSRQNKTRDADPGRSGSWLLALWRWAGAIELSLLLSLAAALAGIWLFAAIADSVTGRQPRHLDEQILLALREPGDPSDPLGPGWFESTMRDFTALGGTGVITLLTLSVVGYLLLRRQYHLVVLVLVTVIGTTILTLVLKAAYDRPRPELVPALTAALSAGFPSGHSSAAAAVYLTLGSLVARLQPRRAVKVLVISLSMLLTLIVGFSRVYLGVHFPSDVVAGWLLGAVWAMLVLLAGRWWSARRTPEPPPA